MGLGGLVGLDAYTLSGSRCLYTYLIGNQP